MNRARMIAVCQMIEADVIADVHRREGQPFTGPVVAAALGEMCAQIGVLAQLIRAILEDPEVTS